VPAAEVAIHATMHNISPSETKAKQVLYAEAAWADDTDDLWEGQLVYEKQKYAQSYDKFTSIPNQQHRRSSKLDVETSGSYIGSTILQTAITFAQGLALDALFNVDLTSAQAGDYSDWRGWSAREINLAFGATLRNASLYNRIAQQGGFTTVNPVSLFRNINGPVELRQVDAISGHTNWYGQTSLTMTNPVTIRFSDGRADAVEQNWGRARQAIASGGTLIETSSTLIQLTNGAFPAGNAFPGNDINLSFPEGFVIDHELSHLLGVNWNLPAKNGRETNLGLVYEEISQDYFSSSVPIYPGSGNTGARSVNSTIEYLTDAAANLANTYSNDLLSADQITRNQIVEELILRILQQKPVI
jgi:hypothetical protein